MLKFIKEKIGNLEGLIKKIMKYGFYFSFILCMISASILFTYQRFYAMPDLYYIGLSLFKTSLTFAISFFICGIAVDRIKKQMI